MKHIVFDSKVTKNKLIYDDKKKEYIHYHGRKRVWSMSGDSQFLDYIQSVIAGDGIIDEHFINRFPMWVKYQTVCKILNKEENH